MTAPAQQTPPRAEPPPQLALLYVCGYKRTGKDTFSRELAEGRFAHRWLVYASSPVGEVEPKAFAELRAAFHGARVAGLADPVRAAVAARLHLPSNYDWDANKDSAIFEGRLLREHLIEEAESRRAAVPGYWAERLFSAVAPAGGKVIVSDFRLPPEVTSLAGKARQHTLRLFREAVPVPPASVATEHGLDAWVTDYLLVPSAADFAACVARLPQYAGFSEIAAL